MLERDFECSKSHPGVECDFECSKSHPGVEYAILDVQLECDFECSKSHPGAKKKLSKTK